MAKVCKGCDGDKLVDDFPVDRSRKDGRGTYCKDCSRAKCRLWYEQNKEKRLQATASYYRNNANKCRAYAVERYKERREEILARTALLRKKPQILCRISEANKRYRSQHKEELAIYLAEWWRSNPEKTRAYGHKRRAYKLAYEGSHFTKADLEELMALQDGKCVYCGTEIVAAFHVDHVIPLSRGGGNGKDNIALSCRFCNLSKGKKTLDEWRPIVVASNPLKEESHE